MNQNSIGQHYHPQELQPVKKSYCFRKIGDQNRFFHVENQTGGSLQFNQNLKYSMMRLQRNSMIAVCNTSRVPTFILNKHKQNANQPQPFAGLGHLVQEDPFANQNNLDIEVSHRNQHRVIKGKVYASQIYYPNPQRNNISFITADKKYPTIIIQHGRENMLEKHRSVKTFQRFNPSKQLVKKNQNISYLGTIEDSRATISSVSSNTSQKQKNQKQLFNKPQNHVPLFIRQKHQKPQAWPFTISPKNETHKKTVQNIQDFLKKKHMKNLNLDDCDSFEDNDSVLSKRQVDVSDFEFCQKLGKGAYGDVFLAKEIHIGFLCVIKKISKKKIREKNLYQNILRQIKIQTYVNHKHLTPIYGVFDDENYVYIILEYMIDGTLAYEIKKQRKMSQKLAAYYLRQLCQAICYMHNESIIHRDIKPDNIFMHYNYLKLGDMGCSVQTETLRNTVVGCLAYVSPEQLGKKYYDQKIDIWSIGILAYQMLFGKPPFQKQLMQMTNEHMQIQTLPDLKFPIDHQISREARNFIQSLLRTDPQERICVKQALQHSFLAKNHSEQGSQARQIVIKMHQILNK